MKKKDCIHILYQDYPKGWRSVSGSSCEILGSEWTLGFPVGQEGAELADSDQVSGRINPCTLQDCADVGLTIKL